MIRDYDDNTEASINIKLKNGTELIGMDIPSNPSGKDDKLISCWINENTLRAYPLSDIEYYEYVFEAR